MNTLSRNTLIGAVGAVTAIAGVLLLAAMAIPADPLGRLVGALIAASFLTGLVAASVREGLARSDLRRFASRKPLPAVDALVPAVIAIPHLVDATASELEAGTHPAFAPVVSLTEEQVERACGARRCQERRAALTQA